MVLIELFEIFQILNELSGEDRYSGVMMWPGGSFPYKNRRPTYLQDWSRDYDLFKRVDKVCCKICMICFKRFKF